MTSDQKRYQSADVRDILRRAGRAGRSDQGGSTAETGLSALELVENAKELGFSGSEVQQALVEFEKDREVTEAQQQVRQIYYRRVSTHAVVFLSVLGLLTVAGAFAAAGTPLYVAAILWGMLFLLQLRGAFFPDPDKLRQEAKQRVLTQKLKDSGKQLGTALATGAAKLMEFSAKKIDQSVKHLDK